MYIGRRPEILADYFEHKQGAIYYSRDRDTAQIKAPPFMDKPFIKTEECSTEELNATIKNLENNKSPGPDGLPSEFFKMIDEEARFIVLDILNDCWKNEITPSELELAELITL